MLEKETNNGWEVVKGENENLVRIYKNMLEEIERDKKKNITATYNGRKKEVLSDLKKFQSTPFWINIPRDYNFFSILSNVRNGVFSMWTSNDEVEPLKCFKDAGKNSWFRCEKLSVEAKKAFSEDEFYHSYTVLYEEDLPVLEALIEENIYEDRLEKKDAMYIYSSLEILKNSIQQKKNYSNERFRFLIAYDN